MPLRLPFPLLLAVSLSFLALSSGLDCVDLHRRRIVRIPHFRGLQIALDNSSRRHICVSNRLCLKVQVLLHCGRFRMATNTDSDSLSPAALAHLSTFCSQTRRSSCHADRYPDVKQLRGSSLSLTCTSHDCHWLKLLCSLFHFCVHFLRQRRNPALKHEVPLWPIWLLARDARLAETSLPALLRPSSSRFTRRIELQDSDRTPRRSSSSRNFNGFTSLPPDQEQGITPPRSLPSLIAIIPNNSTVIYLFTHMNDKWM